MQVEFINQERLYLSQIVVQAVKISLEQKSDSYLQFNSLILLDFLFQNLLPVPTFQNEQSKDVLAGQSSKSSNQNQSINGYKSGDTVVLDIETLEINEHTPEVSLSLPYQLKFDVTSRQYMLMRLNLIFKLWPYIQ